MWKKIANFNCIDWKILAVEEAYRGISDDLDHYLWEIFAL